MFIGYVPHNESVRLDIIHYCYLQTINLIKHQQRLNENFRFRFCIMIFEPLIQAIFCLDFLLNTIRIKMMIFKPLCRH